MCVTSTFSRSFPRERAKDGFLIAWFSPTIRTIRFPGSRFSLSVCLSLLPSSESSLSHPSLRNFAEESPKFPRKSHVPGRKISTKMEVNPYLLMFCWQLEISTKRYQLLRKENTQHLLTFFNFHRVSPKE